jgi:hypothetical protein
MSQVHFAVRGLPESSDRLLDIWQVEPIFGVSFNPDSPAADNNDMIAWSVSLPAELRLAQHLVEMQAGLINQQQQQMRVAEQNLCDLNLAGPAQAAFSSHNIQVDGSPELTLRRNLAQIQARDTEAAFGLRDWLPHWQKTMADYESQLAQILSLLKPTMRVETKIEQRQVACTIIRWNNQLQIVSRPDRAVLHAQLHHQTLALVLQTRLVLLQLLAKASSGAVILAAKLSLPFPVGPLLALPAAWQYLQDLRQQGEVLANFQNGS